MRTLIALFVSLLASLPPLAAEVDVPGRVGRISWIQGAVSAFSDPELGWEKAYVNTPLTSENSLWTDPAARAEIRIGSAAVRLDETTQLDIARLDDKQVRANLTRGHLAVSIRNYEAGDSWIITTPEGRFELKGNGRYRIDADTDRVETIVTVFIGSARLLDAPGRTRIESNQSMRVLGGVDPEFEIDSAVQTEFDQWARGRDDRVVDRVASQYVSPNMTGYEDLDPYGEWNNDPDYGTVWYPTNVAEDWAPYRYGRWTWVRPWGWTWVDDAPWGYAPFHYGRWASINNRWAWYPGSYVARPVWSPALVAWVGSPGWNVSIRSSNAPAIGWYPLAPHDRFQPWYTTNVTYINNVNRVVITNRPAPRENWNRDRGATVVTRENFVSQRSVHNNMVPVSRDVLRNEPVARGDAFLPGRGEARGRTSKPLDFAPGATGAHPVVPSEAARAVAPAPGTPAPGSAAVPRPNVGSAPAYNPQQGGRPNYNTGTQTPRPQFNPVTGAPINPTPNAAPTAVQPNNVARPPVPRPTPQERERQYNAPETNVQRARPTTREAPVARDTGGFEHAPRSPVPVEQRQRSEQPAHQQQQQQPQHQQQPQASERAAPAPKPAARESKPEGESKPQRGEPAK
jgi:FecR protein